MPRNNIAVPKSKAQIQEKVKCGVDPLYFIKHYCYISHPTKGLIKFDTYPFQDDCITEFEAHRFNIVLKSRQLGLSTVCAAYCLWMSLFQEQKNIVVLATRLDVAKNFLRKVLTMYDSLPAWLVMPKETARTVKSIEFSNGSRISAVPTGDDAGRGEGVSLLVVDEAAHIQGFDELWQGLWSTISTGGNVIMLSCVTKDTYVYTNTGPKKIAEFIPPGNIPGDYIFTNPYVVQGHSKTRTGNLWHNQGIAKTRKLTTRYGELEGSLIHKVWACQDGKFGWYQHQQLKVGDWVAHYGGQELWGSNNSISSLSDNYRRTNKLVKKDIIDADFAYLLGLYIAEGSQKKTDGKTTGITITCGDDISELFNILGLRYYKNDSCHYQISSAELVEIMQSVGFDLGTKASGKKIPSRLLEMGRENIVALLQGIFDGDGTAHKTTGSVSLTSKSPELVGQIRMLLSNFGIWSTREHILKEKINAYASVKHKHNYDSHKLECNGKNAKLFYEQIGFRLSRKQERSKLLSLLNFHRATSYDVVPFSFEIAKELIKATKIKPRLLAEYGIKNVMNVWGHNSRSTPHLSRVMLQKLRTFADLNLPDERKKELDGIIFPNIRWAEIKEIHEGEAEVYDFSLPTNIDDQGWDHSIIYGNILGHQTPKGVSNVFHKTWTDCDLEKNKNDFHGIKLPWTVHPEHDQLWFEEQCRNLDPRGIQQELLCVGPNTKIPTKNGYSLASNIKIGDEVLTHKGRFRKVLAVNSRLLNPQETLWKVSLPCNRQSPLFITGNHPVLSYKFHLPKGKSQFGWFKHLRKTELLNEARFESLDDLNDFQCKTNKKVYGVLHPVCFQNMFKETSSEIDLASLVPSSLLADNDKSLCFYPNQTQKYGLTPRYQPTDYDLGRFLGLAMAEGCITRSYNKTNNCVTSLQLAFHADENDTLVKFVEEFYNARNVRFSKITRSYSRCITITTCNKFILALYNKFIDNKMGATSKIWRMNELLLHASQEMVLGCLVGHFEGDGDHPKAIAKNNNGNKIKLVSRSKALLYQTRTLLSAWGHYPRMSEDYLEIDGLSTKFNGQIRDLFNVPKTSLECAKSKTHLYEKELVGKFQKTLVDHSNVSCVYDIEVEEDHSFIAEGLIVHNCSFLGSGHTYLHETSLAYLNEMTMPPIERLGVDRGIWIWKYPVSTHKYLISADVARGDSDDFSTCHVIDTEDDEVVAEYQGRIPPDRFAELLDDLGRKYYFAVICPENNTFGLATAYRLRDMNYPNLYYEKFAKAGIHQHYTPEEVAPLMPGLSTTVKNRQAILAKLEEVVRNKKLKVYSTRFVEEAKTFIWNTNIAGGKAQAMKGYNDDLIMSLAIGCYIYEASENQVDTDELNRAMLAAWGKSVTRMNTGDFANSLPQDVGNEAQNMAFQRTGHGSEYAANQNGQKPFYDKEPTQQNMKPGVSIEQAKPAINFYNLYSWLFK